MDPVDATRTLDLVRVLFFKAANDEEIALAFAQPAMATMKFGSRLRLNFDQRVALLKALRG